MRIQALYQQGQKFTCWPVRVTWLPIDGPSEVLIWAPKSLFKHAVDRNRLRRQMREAWRLNNDHVKTGYRVAVNYIDKQMQPYALIEKSIKKAVQKLSTYAPTHP